DRGAVGGTDVGERRALAVPGDFQVAAGHPGVRHPEIGLLASADHVAALFERVRTVRTVVDLECGCPLSAGARWWRWPRGWTGWLAGRLSGGLAVRIALCWVTAGRTRRPGRLAVGVTLCWVTAGRTRRSGRRCGLAVTVGVLAVAGRSRWWSGWLAVRIGLAVARLTVAGGRPVAVGVLLVRIGLTVARLAVAGLSVAVRVLAVTRRAGRGSVGVELSVAVGVLLVRVRLTVTVGVLLVRVVLAVSWLCG